MIKLLAKPVAEAIQTQLKERILNFKKSQGRSPKLAVVLVGEDPASVIYTRKKGETALALGMEHETITLPASSSPAEVKSVVSRLNEDPRVDGILIQRPLPKTSPASKNLGSGPSNSHSNRSKTSFDEEDVVYWISPEKDVDAFHPENTGRLVLGLPCFLPCTPAGIMALLKYYQIDPAGKTACIIGRSSIVGKPMASLLLKADATVIHCHSRTTNLRDLTRQAEILVVAAGKPELIDASYLRQDGKDPKPVVIDVGVHRTAQGKLVGDVQFDSVAPLTSAISPVPGGVGPMTIAILMENTVTAAERRAGLAR